MALRAGFRLAYVVSAMVKPVFAPCSVIHSAAVWMTASKTSRVRAWAVRSQALRLLMVRAIGLEPG